MLSKQVKLMLEWTGLSGSEMLASPTDMRTYLYSFFTITGIQLVGDLFSIDTSRSLERYSLKRVEGK